MTTTSVARLCLERGHLVVNDNVFAIATPDRRLTTREMGTVLSNLAHFGVVPSARSLEVMRHCDREVFHGAWKNVESLLADVFGTSRHQDDVVVYKNFPGEVLEMSSSEYWIRQILMYLGLPNDMVTEVPDERPVLDEAIAPRVITLSDSSARNRVLDDLVASPTQWRPVDVDAAAALFSDLAGQSPDTIDVGAYTVRTNALMLAHRILPGAPDTVVATRSATDVLRLAAALSGCDVTLAQKPRFASFSRPLRRKLLGILETCHDPQEDFARHPEAWKHLLSRLHPGEMKFPRVSEAYAALHNGLPDRMNARLERAFAAGDAHALDILSQDPGLFARCLNRAHSVFGREAIERFIAHLPALTTDRLLRLEGHFREIPDCPGRIVRPRGRWSRAKIIDPPAKIPGEADRVRLIDALRAERAGRLRKALPDGVDLDPDAGEITLPVNGQELANHGPGTVFDIPDTASFLRTASYWEHPEAADSMNTWFDNGWNLFDSDWTPAGACCWNHERHGDAAVFSGDPTNSKDLDGRGCQTIDLYLDKLEKSGIRYAVWSLLCYSHVPFHKANDVLATLQWGETPKNGEIYEPSRAQMVFPVRGKGFNRFIAYVDIAERKLVSLDLELPASVRTAENNSKLLSSMMPHLIAHIRTLPRIADVFSPIDGGSTPVLRSDADRPVSGPGWVFEKRNEDSDIEDIDIAGILAAKGA